jgi:SMI1 / KNR4 family (SUKH-1)
MKDYTDFLKQVESLNKVYASIYFNCELESLTMPFWSWEEIQNGLEQRLEWEVDKTLIPFYGDWHELFCLNADSGEIVALNDEREVLYTWDSVKVFLSSLSEKEIIYDDGTMAARVHHYENAKDQELKH